MWWFWGHNKEIPLLDMYEYVLKEVNKHRVNTIKVHFLNKTLLINIIYPKKEISSYCIVNLKIGTNSKTLQPGQLKL